MMRQRVDLSIRSLYLDSEGRGPRLRVGVLLDSTSVPANVHAVLADIAACSFADVCAVVLAAPAGAVTATGTMVAQPATVADEARSGAFGAYLKYLDPRHAVAPDPLEPTDCSALIAGCPSRSVVAPTRHAVARIPPDAVAWLRDLRLDVILHFGLGAPHDDVLTVARCGIWSYRYGDAEFYRGGPPFLWELIERNPVSGVALLALDSSPGGGVVLCSATLATSPTPSVSANRFAPMWVSEHFVIRKLRELHEDGWESVRSRGSTTGPYRGRQALYRPPGVVAMVRWLAPLVLRAVRSRLRREHSVPHWQIALRRSPIALYDDPSPEQLSRFRLIESPRGRFWADPFLFEFEDRLWLLFEEFDYATNRGRLCGAELDGDGRLGATCTVLERPYHLSYPCIVRNGPDVYMLPESEAAGGVDLLRAKRFPDEWEHVSRLLDFPVVDATPFRHQDRWWMFASPMTAEGHAPITLLFTAQGLRGPWRHVRASPIASDVRRARSGGMVIASGDRLLRPTQDCGVRYGRALAFREITSLSETRFAESDYALIEPNWLDHQLGVHTYNRSGDWEVVDVNVARRASEIL